MTMTTTMTTMTRMKTTLRPVNRANLNLDWAAVHREDAARVIQRSFAEAVACAVRNGRSIASMTPADFAAGYASIDTVGQRGAR